MSRRSTRGAPAAPPARLATSQAPTPTPGPSFPPSTIPQPLSLPPDAPFAAQYRTLRTHWKWANFSQFFFTFAALFNMLDVSIVDIEDDLARGTNIVLSRVMCRLMVVLMQDRKLTTDTWQASMRRQYLRRDPDKNPLGPPPVLYARTATPELVTEPTNAEAGPSGAGDAASANGDEAKAEAKGEAQDVEMKDATDGDESKHNGDAQSNTVPEHADNPPKSEDVLKSENALQPEEQQEEPRDWLTLSLLEKLDSMVLLTEWQFQNQARLRQTMKSDDENAMWRVEPIGYDRAGNAYWFIGADRLWIQRTPPRPPRPLKRKRPAPKKKAPSPSPSPPSEQSEPEENIASKRPRRTASTKKPNGRANANKGKAKAVEAEVEVEEETSGRGSRKAKTQANAKLDAQAKELAALQRQAALEKRRGPAPAPVPAASASSPRATRGTRVSARLRGAESEWQDVPEEWLAGEGKGKGRDGDGEDGEEDGLGKTGLEEEDGNVSDLTSLSELSDLEPEPAQEEEVVEEEVVQEEKPAPRLRRAAAKSKSKKKAPSRARGAKVAVEDEDEAEEEVVEEKVEEEEWKPPADWIEWEAIAITLREWEVVAEPFAKATHYTEKALYKRLTLEIAPIVIGAMREAEKRRLLEESVQSRKRSSRLVAKEHEANEIKAAAEKQREEEERMARTRRAEAREKKEAEERERRENARDARRREREEREERRRKMTEAEREANATTGDEDGDVDVDGDEQEESEPESEPAKKTRKRKRTAPSKPALTADAPDATTPSSKPRAKRAPKDKEHGEHHARARKSSGKEKDWVLACELCTNTQKDTSVQLVQCVACQRWQHIACHDNADARAGRPRRDWRRVQFRCARCAQPAGGAPVTLSAPGQGQHGQRYAPGGVGVQAYGVRGYAGQPGQVAGFPSAQEQGARYANGAQGYGGTNGVGAYTGAFSAAGYGAGGSGSAQFGYGNGAGAAYGQNGFGNGSAGSAPFGGPQAGATRTIYSARAQEQGQDHSQGQFALQPRASLGYQGYPAQSVQHQHQPHAQQPHLQAQQPHPHASQQQQQYTQMSPQDQQAYMQQRQYALQQQQQQQQQQALRQQHLLAQQQQQQPVYAAQSGLAHLTSLAHAHGPGSMSPHSSSMPGTPHTPQQAPNGFFSGPAQGAGAPRYEGA